jgi:hypothetical protein
MISPRCRCAGAGLGAHTRRSDALKCKRQKHSLSVSSPTAEMAVFWGAMRACADTLRGVLAVNMISTERPKTFQTKGLRCGFRGQARANSGEAHPEKTNFSEN